MFARFVLWAITALAMDESIQLYAPMALFVPRLDWIRLISDAHQDFTAPVALRRLILSEMILRSGPTLVHLARIVLMALVMKK